MSRDIQGDPSTTLPERSLLRNNPLRVGSAQDDYTGTSGSVTLNTAKSLAVQVAWDSGVIE